MFRSLAIFTLFTWLILQTFASPAPAVSLMDSLALVRRTDPVFPDSPASCPICAKDYSSINNCAQAAPVLANFSMIIFNPGAFIDIIQCACTETFQSVFPQCVDCFIQTDQQDVLNTPNLPSIVDGMRKICALASTLLGNVSGVNGYITPTSQAPVPIPTSGDRPTSFHDSSLGTTVSIIGLALLMGIFGM
ncbi:hypothetical protein B0H34DRAFT_720852 [Crassisporium funariophilum]|nr:hypothetical protein B0H34DRAFT_720852 [Crassisporium funariophilum]